MLSRDTRHKNSFLCIVCFLHVTHIYTMSHGLFSNKILLLVDTLIYTLAHEIFSRKNTPRRGASSKTKDTVKEREKKCQKLRRHTCVNYIYTCRHMYLHINTCKHVYAHLENIARVTENGCEGSETKKPNLDYCTAHIVILDCVGRIR